MSKNAKNMYAINQSLSQRLVKSIILYLEDTIDPKMSPVQKEQSVAAAITLCDCAITYMNDALPVEQRTSLERIFSRIIYDLQRNNTSEKVHVTRKNISALQTILNLV